MTKFVKLRKSSDNYLRCVLVDALTEQPVAGATVKATLYKPDGIAHATVEDRQLPATAVAGEYMTIVPAAEIPVEVSTRYKLVYTATDANGRKLTETLRCSVEE